MTAGGIIPYEIPDTTDLSGTRLTASTASGLVLGLYIFATPRLEK